MNEPNRHFPFSFLCTFQHYRCFVPRDGCHVGPRISAAPGASVVSKAAPKVPQAKAVARAVPGDDSDVDAWQWEKPWYEVEKRWTCFGKTPVKPFLPKKQQS